MRRHDSDLHVSTNDRVGDGPGSVPVSLQHPELAPLWAATRGRLDRFGNERRGTVALPALGDDARLALHSLLGSRPPSRLDLAVLESRLVAIGLGADLDAALTRLGAARSPRVAAVRTAEHRRAAIRTIVVEAVSVWPESWSDEWGEWVLRTGQFAGLDPDEVSVLFRRCRAIIDAIGSITDPLARTDLAARFVGSAHGLDDGVVLERCVQRALRHTIAPAGRVDDAPSGRDAWNRAGVQTDQVSAPVLTWNLHLDIDSPVGAITSAANRAGLPVHLSTFALKSGPIVSTGGPVLVVENPRLVEAAAERATPWPVVATNGNPAGAVTMLIDALVAVGNEVRAHADFDCAGIGICRRLHDRGCSPWKMGGADYGRAVDRAHAAGITLPGDAGRCGPTIWDPYLETEFDSRRAVVHEELVIDDLLDGTDW